MPDHAALPLDAVVEKLKPRRVARLVRITRQDERFDQRLYAVEPAAEYCRGTTAFLWVSAAVVPYRGPETYVFPANSKGRVLDWGELDGSFKGGLDHEQALRNAGYEVVSS